MRRYFTYNLSQSINDAGNMIDYSTRVNLPIIKPKKLVLDMFVFLVGCFEILFSFIQEQEDLYLFK